MFNIVSVNFPPNKNNKAQNNKKYQVIHSQI